MKYLHKVYLVNNLRRHQPFDYCEDSTLANDNPRDIKDQSVQNVLAHWIPKFIIGSMHELVTDNNSQKLGESNIHTLTCKQPDKHHCPYHSKTLGKLPSHKKQTNG